MQAIPPTPSHSGPSMGAPLNDGVLRFGATQEARETLRRDRSDEVAREEDVGPEDHALITDMDAMDGAAAQEGDAAPTSTSSSSSGGHVHGHESARRRESGDGTPPPGTRSPAEDGTENQRQAALAQHGAEQQGKRELGRQDGDRSLRSTRDMMGRVEGARGGGEAHESKGGGAAQHSSAPAKGAHGGASAASGHGEAKGASHGDSGSGAVHRGSSGGGGHAPAASGSAPRVTGEVLAAVVGSGLATVDDVDPGAAQSSDSSDDEGQQVDSSQESIQARLTDQGTKTQKSQEMGSGLHFGGDGERGRSFDDERKFGGGFPNQRRTGPGTGDDREDRDEKQERAGEQTSSGAGSDEHQPPPQEAVDAPTADDRPAEKEAREEVASPPQPEAVASAAPEAATDPGATDPGAAQPVPLERHHEIPAAAPAEPTSASPGARPTEAVSLPGRDRVERSKPVSLGIDWMADTEYFFFDDARHTPEEEQAAGA